MKFLVKLEIECCQKVVLIITCSDDLIILFYHPL